VKVNILGDGSWGSALGRLLTANGHKVSFWDKKSQIQPLDLVVVALPAQVIRGVINDYGRDLKKAVILNCSKGIERNTHKIPIKIFKEVLGREVEYFTLIGPSFALEVDRRMPTLVNLGGSNGKTQLICDFFETDYFRVRPTKSIEALELAGALKNVYAIACGIAEGLGFQINTRAKLITIAYEEYQRLAKNLGYEIDEDARPGILGDLVLTCSSLESRNFRFGKNLTKFSVKESLAKINSTVEGYGTSFSVAYFSERSPMPLAEFVLRVIREDNQKLIKDKFADFVKKI
jgi:glycerol-3-phosphate dehydrogenase (NAD(P)+)